MILTHLIGCENCTSRSLVVSQPHSSIEKVKLIMNNFKVIQTTLIFQFKNYCNFIHRSSLLVSNFEYIRFLLETKILSLDISLMKQNLIFPLLLLH